MTDEGFAIAFEAGRKQGKIDAYNEIIEQCEKYSYTCHSSEMAKILRQILKENKDE